MHKLQIDTNPQTLEEQPEQPVSDEEVEEYRMTNERRIAIISLHFTLCGLLNMASHFLLGVSPYDWKSPITRISWLVFVAGVAQASFSKTFRLRRCLGIALALGGLWCVVVVWMIMKRIVEEADGLDADDGSM